MVIHMFICDTCRITIEDANTKIIHKCPQCGQDMRWDLSGIGIAKGDFEHISDSLAISPEQIPEHRTHFPNIDVLSDGRIKFTSIKQYDNYLDKTGFRKIPQKIKYKGKKIC